MTAQIYVVGVPLTQKSAELAKQEAEARYKKDLKERETSLKKHILQSRNYARLRNIVARKNEYKLEFIDPMGFRVIIEKLN